MLKKLTKVQKLEQHVCDLQATVQRLDAERAALKRERVQLGEKLGRALADLRNCDQERRELLKAVCAAVVKGA